MTQPIQEPTVHRALAGSKWNENQLYRRPAPPPESGISVFRAYRALSPISVSGNGTTQDVNWDVWENCDEEVFDYNTLGDVMIQLDLLVPGNIVICWGIKFDDATDDSVALMLIDDEPVFGSQTYQTVHGRVTNGVQAMEAGSQIMIQTFSRSYPTLDIFNSGDQFPVRFTFHAAQITGSTNDIIHAFLDVRFEQSNICTGPILS